MSLKEREEKLMDKSAEAEVAEVENETGKVGWAEMLPEALVEVFKRLPLRDRLSIPQICKAWKKVSFDPVCWQFIDLIEFCCRQSGEIIDPMVKCIVERSCGSIQELRVCCLNSDASLHYLSQSATFSNDRRLSSLKTLCIHGSDITESALCELILTTPALVHLDISKCDAIESQALEVIGQTCKSLTRLDRGMLRIHAANFFAAREGSSDDSEALAIAENMPKLKHLELEGGLLSVSGLMAILDKCQDLEYLDVMHCPYVMFPNSVVESKCSKLRTFLVSTHTRGEDYDGDEYEDDLAYIPWEYSRGYRSSSWAW